MYINALTYQDQSSNWQLQRVEFTPLVLLVGVSGAGKTQILKALLNLKKIALGKSLNGLKWEIEFKDHNGDAYKWVGEFENKGFFPEAVLSNWLEEDLDENDKPKIESEFLFINGQSIVERFDGQIFFNGSKTVKLSQQESVLSLLKEEDQIKSIYENFKHIDFYDNSRRHLSFSISDEIESKIEKYVDIKSIRNSDENIKTKLCLAYKIDLAYFRIIVDDFIAIFPNIEDIRIEPISHSNKKLRAFFNEMLLIEVKEKDVPHWIDEDKISSGMLRTLLHIAELYLCADDTVILIDEFENSLGINCINQVTRSILHSERRLQFIITSHHPYIINDIGYEHWKLVTRKGSVVDVIEAEKFGIGKSKHQAFTQLANLTAFSEGIAH